MKEGLRFPLAVTWPHAERLQEQRAAENQRLEKMGLPPKPAHFADITPDVQAAVSAWLWFGGLGARARRGCGALHLQGGPDACRLPLRIPAGCRVFIGRPCGSGAPAAMQAWADAVQVYQRYRQSFRGGLHPKRRGAKSHDVPGRSYWPEPDSIRNITGCALREPGAAPGTPDDINTHDHSRPIVPRAAIPSFPRAVLGLPIVFHFSDGPGHDRPARRDRDPAGVELRPFLGYDQDGQPLGERMASPVITRPLWYQDQWVPAVIFLPYRHALAVEARLVGKQAVPPGTPLSVVVPNSQLVGPVFRATRPGAGCDNALDGLMQFLGQTADGMGKPKPVFREVTGP